MDRPHRVARVGLALSLLTAWGSGCEREPADDPELIAYPDTYTIAVMLPLPEQLGELRELEWPVARVNAAGGVHGHSQLQLRYVGEVDASEAQSLALAQELIDDPEVAAVIGMGDTSSFMAIAPLFIASGKPLLSFNNTSGEVLRAFGGSNGVWRTKLTDLVQAEFIVRQLRSEGEQRLGLLATTDDAGRTFFNWFNFYAQDQGYASADLMVETLGEDIDSAACEAAVTALMEAELDAIVIATPPTAFGCTLEALIDQYPTPEDRSPRLVFADLGVEYLLALSEYGSAAAELEGWSAGFAADYETFEALWNADFDDLAPTANAAPAHDAILLVAYGLELAAAQGLNINQAIEQVVAGEGEALGYALEDIERGLTALRAGERPHLGGAMGPLRYDPDTLVDLSEGVLTHWQNVLPETSMPGPPPMPRLEYDLRVEIGPDNEPSFAGSASENAFEAPGGASADAYEPSVAVATGTQALIIAASDGWDNYRHQADALARYQLLRAAGLSDDDIVMIGADDIVDNTQNPLPGIVRNTPGGDDVYAGVRYDYGLDLHPAQLAAVLLGESSADTPAVLELDEGTNLYVYLVGHGGLFGVGFGASSLDEGLGSAGVEYYEPDTLRETLCTLREMDAVRRVFVELESCYAGVYGDADFNGLEAGCNGGVDPLTGVALLTASGTLENSLGSGWDAELSSWVSDEFSAAMIERFADTSARSISELYREVYLDVAGSHAGAYNTARYGDIEQLTLAEFGLMAP